MYTKDLLQKTNITKDALRHYNDLDLVKPTINSTNNYKIYSTADVEAILFIKKAKKIGFSLNEIKEMATQLNTSKCKHQSLLPYLENNLEDIEEKIITLKKMKKHISQLIKDYKKRNCNVKPTDLKM
ncbi:MAG: MerR family transcriptional regulator [Candidatus Moraniibacteriota bacterium]|jgi:DNA-binding transcriptional MerR regulator